MRIVRTVKELRTALLPARREGRTVGLVPTMGALHEGHLSLIRAARADNDVVVVTVFVNPTQFDEAADLAGYPRDEATDATLAAGAGADLLFAPPVEEVYPDGFVTSVRVDGPLVDTLEGEHRGSGHFAGVTTVVTKLLNMAQPDSAYFGAKDAQQALVVKRVVRDLDMPVRIEVCPTLREEDGVALSSRNVHLRGADRVRARALSTALRAAQAAVASGVRDTAAVREQALAAMTDFDVEPEYLVLVDPESLSPLTSIDGPVLVAVAARVGTTRLIDNTLIPSSSTNGAHP